MSKDVALSDIYKGCMIIGNYFSKHYKNIKENDDWDGTEDWSGTIECATYAEAVYHLANNINVGMETACKIVIDMIKEVGFYQKTDHGWDDYTRGFLAGEVFGIPTESAVQKAILAEIKWKNDSRKANPKFGYYQEVLDEVNNE